MLVNPDQKLFLSIIDRTHELCAAKKPDEVVTTLLTDLNSFQTNVNMLKNENRKNLQKLHLFLIKTLDNVVEYFYAKKQFPKTIMYIRLMKEERSKMILDNRREVDHIVLKAQVTLSFSLNKYAKELRDEDEFSDAIRNFREAIREFKRINPALVDKESLELFKDDLNETLTVYEKLHEPKLRFRFSRLKKLVTIHPRIGEETFQGIVNTQIFWSRPVADVSDRPGLMEILQMSMLNGI